MLRPRQGCDIKEAATEGSYRGQDVCFRRGDDDFAILFDDQPITTWYIAIAASLVEAYVFIFPILHFYITDLIHTAFRSSSPLQWYGSTTGSRKSVAALAMHEAGPIILSKKSRAEMVSDDHSEKSTTRKSQSCIVLMMKWKAKE